MCDFADSCLVREALQMDHASLPKQFEHLDPHNQNTFEAKDLELLISTVRSFPLKVATSGQLTDSALSANTANYGFSKKSLG